MFKRLIDIGVIALVLTMAHTMKYDMIMQQAYGSESIIQNSVVFYYLSYVIPTVNICIGTPPQCLQMGIDTGSSYTIVSRPSNDKVFNKAYNEFSSSTVRVIPSADQGMNHYYQIYNIQGHLTEDYLSFPNSTSYPQTKTRLTFLVLHEHKQVTKVSFDGFIGMNLQQKKLYNKDSTYDFPFNFDIRNTMVALRYFYNGTGELYINHSFSIKRNYCQFPISNNNNWFCQATMIKVGNESFPLNNNRIYFLSAGNLITIPTKFIKVIKKIFLAESKGLCNVDTINEIGVFFCDKNVDFDALSDIEFHFGTGYLRVKWRNLMRYEEYEKTPVFIGRLVISEDWYDFIEIGFPGFIDNIIVFDRETRTIGFLESIDLSDNEIVSLLYSCVIVLGLLGGVLLLYIKHRYIY